MTALFGYSIESDFPLSRIRPAPSHRGVIELRRAEVDPLAREGEIVSWWDENDLQLVLATSGDELLLWCSTTGSFGVSAAERRITAAPIGGPDWWEHRLGSLILPLLLADRGDLALHAAAIEFDQRALIVCGESGAGKSTLAAAMSLAGRPVLSEDGVVLSGLPGAPTVWPGLDGVRVTAEAFSVLAGEELSRAHEAGKLIRLQGGRPIGALPAAAVVFLEPRTVDEPAIDRVEALSALPALVGHGLCRGPDGLPSMMRRAASLLDHVPAFKVALPNDLSAVPDHAEALIAAIGAAF